MKINEVMILAGGLGTRLRPVVSEVPKVLAPVSDKPFLFYILDFWIKKGINKFVICIGYKGDLVKNVIKNSIYKNIVKLSYETQKLGTGGAILKAVKLIESDDFLIQNGDTFIPINLDQVYSIRKKIKDKAIFMVLIKQKDVSRYGAFTLHKNHHVSLTKGIRNNKKLINGGIYVCNKQKLSKEFLDENKELSFENDILPVFLNKNEVIGDFCDNPFIDIGVPIDYDRAGVFLSEHFNS